MRGTKELKKMIQLMLAHVQMLNTVAFNLFYSIYFSDVTCTVPSKEKML